MESFSTCEEDFSSSGRFCQGLDDQELSRHEATQPLDNVQLGKCIGKGGCGKVYLGSFTDHRGRTTGQMAVKCMSKKKVSRRDLSKQLALEIAVHQGLVHPNVIRLYDFTQDAHHVYLFIEFAQLGDLFEYAKRYQPDEAQISRIMYQVGQALAFIHSCGVVHRDMKPENILMDHRHVPKITDFGYCDRTGPDGYCENPMFCGTTDYLMYTTIDDLPCSYFVDTWAFGVIIFDLLVGEPPFHESTHRETYRRIRNCRVYWDDPDIAPFVVNCRPLLETIFISQPDHIPDMVDVVQDEWFHMF